MGLIVDEKKCTRCGVVKDFKKFKTDKRQIDGRTITCRECYTNNKLDKFFRTDEQIESQRKKLIGRKYSLEHRVAISEGQKLAVKEGKHHWKIRDYRHKDQDRTSLEYRIWKEKVIDLRGGKCKMCEKTTRLHCHHIKSYYSFPDLRFSPENGELLCISCHMRWHRIKDPQTT